MKHFTVPITKSRGLRPFAKSVRNSFELIDCLNFKPTSRGYVPYLPLENPFPEGFLESYGVQLSWPWPQLHIGKKRTFLTDRTRLFLVDSRDWSMPLYEIEPGSGTIQPGGKWDFIDLYDFFVFSNGVCSVYYLNTDEMRGGTNDVIVKSTKVFQAGTYNRGRVMLGGFNYENFWESSWKTLWTTWLTKKKNTTINDDVVKPEGSIQMPIEPNFVWWSSIGGGDVQAFFNTSFFEDGILGPSGYGSDKPWIFDIMQRNEWGFAPMPFQGSVLEILPLGKWNIVYCENGVQAMLPVAEPSPTYLQVTFPCPGIANRGAVAGNDSRHVMVDKTGTLWEIVSDGNGVGANVLGFQEYLESYVGNTPIVSYAADPYTPETGEWYVSTIDGTYVLTGKDLFRTSQLVTSASMFQGRKIGLGSHITDGDNEQGLIVTDKFDFGSAGIKTLEWVHLPVANLSFLDRQDNLHVAVDYRYARHQQFTTTDYKLVNDEGEVYFPVSGTDFRLRIKATNFLRFDLGTDIGITYKRDDRRYTKSLDVGASTA